MAAKREVSGLEAHLGYWLRRVSNQVSHAFRLKVEACGVSVSEWVVLRELYRPEGASPGALAQSLGMTKGAVSKLVGRLEDKGLATRSPSEVDRRQQAVALTANGRALVPRLAHLADANDEEFFGHLPRPVRDELMRVLRELARTHHLDSAPID
ncbi:MarR family winged helix-turn-helix transcriptional regulator [Nannocystis punicea]|uniref:MarR family transcriptional regulator n=1 Tax=Nannocystis punicea TaxID=2995304 RepID=A0ABY7H5P4_9BACT|nr:MarR family transcriptional regulator [Nannocystis poenicansa]WAS94586.1 MarR family transcriptional regulator [Nannocystis poenicansa]